MDEKAKKVESHLQKYNQWWLLLIDHMNFMKCPESLDEVKSHLTLPKAFKKMILTSSLSNEEMLKLSSATTTKNK